MIINYKTPMTMFLLLLIEVKLLTLCFEFSLVESSAHNYAGAKMLRVTPHRDEHLHFLSGIRHQYDFWTEPKQIGQPLTIVAKKDHLKGLKKSLEDAGLSYKVTDFDLQKRILDEKETNDRALRKIRRDLRAKPGSATISWTAYHHYEEIMAWVDSLEKTYPNLVKVENVGKSYEGREMKLVKISQKGSGKKAIFIDGGIHAREWISPATVTYIMNELLVNQDKYQYLLNNIDFYFMPLINPDGYAYTFTTDRMWRKTRSLNPGSECVGTDPNRNWDHQWMVSGASRDPCEETYAGAKPFSEIEMRTVRDQIMKYKDQTEMYISYHSFGQDILYGWGYEAKDPPNVQDLMKLASKASNAIFKTYGKKYKFGGAGKLLYPASGAADDFAKGVAGIKYSFTIELRPSSNIEENGFMLKSEEIIPCAIENFAALQVMLNHIISEKE